MKTYLQERHNANRETKTIAQIGNEVTFENSPLLSCLFVPIKNSYVKICCDNNKINSLQRVNRNFAGKNNRLHSQTMLKDFEKDLKKTLNYFY